MHGTLWLPSSVLTVALGAALEAPAGAYRALQGLPGCLAR